MEESIKYQLSNRPFTHYDSVATQRVSDHGTRLRGPTGRDRQLGVSSSTTGSNTTAATYDADGARVPECQALAWVVALVRPTTAQIDDNRLVLPPGSHFTSRVVRLPNLSQPDQVLTARITRAHAMMTAALADLMAAVVEAEEDGSYWAQGSQSAPEWLVANLRIHSRTARTWTRTAKKLADYPVFGALMAAGDLGIDQIYEILKFVEPKDQKMVADDVVESSAEELAGKARSFRRVTPRRVEKTRQERWFEGFSTTTK